MSKLSQKIGVGIVKSISEFNESVIFVKWSKYNPIASEYLFAIPNGGSRHPSEAKNLKRQGVRKGVSDYFLPYPINGKHGLWIELKKDIKCRATKEQADWLKKMHELGYEAKLAFSAREAIKAVEDYLKIGI
jgi:hypothetical protein